MRLEYQKSSKERVQNAFGQNTLFPSVPCTRLSSFSPADSSNSLSYLNHVWGLGTDSIIIIHSRIFPPRVCSCLSHVRVHSALPLFYSIPSFFSILFYSLFYLLSYFHVVVVSCSRYGGTVVHIYSLFLQITSITRDASMCSFLSFLSFFYMNLWYGTTFIFYYSYDRSWNPASMDLFVYNEIYCIWICTSCHYAVTPWYLDRHLRTHHRQYLSAKTAELRQAALTEMLKKLWIEPHKEPSRFSPPDILPILYLPVYSELRCPLCPYIGGYSHTIRKHIG